MYEYHWTLTVRKAQEVSTNECLEKYFYATVRRCKALIHECLDVDVGERGHQEHAVTPEIELEMCKIPPMWWTVSPVQYTAMTRNERSKVFPDRVVRVIFFDKKRKKSSLPVASSLESTAEESGHGSQCACEEADHRAVQEERGGRTWEREGGDGNDGNNGKDIAMMTTMTTMTRWQT